MYISGIKVYNYKSYLESEKVKFQSGFNIVFGQNNAGKTSLLEALSLQSGNRPHRSLKSLPDRNTKITDYSTLDICFKISREEFSNLIEELGTTQFNIPRTGELQTSIDLLNKYLLEGYIEITCTVQEGRIHYINPVFLDHYRANVNGGNFPTWKVMWKDGRFINGSTETKDDLQNVLWSRVFTVFKNKIYCFRAERLNIASGSTNNNPDLKRDASNLPEVLYYMKNTNPKRWKRYNEWVRKVFPQVYEVGINPIGNGTIEITTWTVDPETEREDLRIPLAESGTGIGQVLAIFYVVINSNFPQTIIIDEPQSFLHPGAARKLIEIIKADKRHQYIIATHSPTIIAASNPNTITQVIHKDHESKINQIDPKDIKGLSASLAEVGARLSDVFGADNILWVEGPTEEKCFPLIIERMLKKPLMGTTVLGVVSTGGLQGKQYKTVHEVYKKLSSGNGLIPPAIAFIFDREDKSNEEISKLTEKEMESLKFLNRMMYENYLLNPRAISYVLSGIEDISKESVSEKSVEEWINANKDNSKYYTRKVKDAEGWFIEIHAARFLHDLFNQLTDCTVEFRKTEHSVALTEWLIDNEPEKLREVADLLAQVFPE